MNYYKAADGSIVPFESICYLCKQDGAVGTSDGMIILKGSSKYSGSMSVYGRDVWQRLADSYESWLNRQEEIKESNIEIRAIQL